MMIFDILLLSGIIIMWASYDQYKYHVEGSDTYKLLQSIWNFGFWLTFMGLLKYIIKEIIWNFKNLIRSLV